MLETERQLDWLAWFERWEQMLACYNPGRAQRLHLMVSIPALPNPGWPRILDLGAGPGATSLTVLRHYPGATVLAVEYDRLLVEMGQAVAAQRGLGDRLRYLAADLRDPDWWRAYESEFDLVVSATALHWLNAAHYGELCERVFRVLRPGGWFMNCDHVASLHDEVQVLYNRYRADRARRAFEALGADRWDDFWAALAAALGTADLAALRGVEGLWEGSDDGIPKQAHLAALERSGFELAEVYWQELGEAIIGGRRPRK
ncbi:MAG: class I SAM-dependent methyltransferase [Armatimonadetes bacterium]|nr:class I SAM-dependent methyltransferase [Armatimonadota bacterium]